MSDVVEIPYQQLSADALQGVLEEFVNREGTDYGEFEYSLADKISQLREALASGDALIVFDPVLESCTLMQKEAFLRLGV